jgi:peroxiredoxin
MVCAILALQMDTHSIAVGDTAPDFSLPDSIGQKRRLSELVKDSPLVLVFYRGHW